MDGSFFTLKEEEITELRIMFFYNEITLQKYFVINLKQYIFDLKR